MRKVKLYIAMSLNGKIARKSGEVDWLESMANPDNNDYGYSKFYQSIDTTIQGYNTYTQLISWGIQFPYADKKNYVFTNRNNLKDTEYVEFITENHTHFVKELKNKKGLDIWLIGGGTINTQLLNAQLIDEIFVFVMPIILPDGIELFELVPKETLLKLEQCNKYSSGAIELIYKAGV
jgi:dihydrofolate reductase